MKMNIAEFLIKSAEEYPKQTALTFENEKMPFAILNERANRLANALKDENVKKGEHIGVFSTTYPQLIETLFAAAKIGAVFIPFNYRLKEEETIGVINDSQVEYVFYESRYHDLLFKNKQKLPIVKRWICIDQKLADVGFYEDILRSGDYGEPGGMKTKGDEPAIILYTSGTSGFPKGVLYSHKQLITRIEERRKSLSILSPGSIALLVVPLFHTGGIQAILGAIRHPFSMVLLRQFDARSFLEIVQNEKVESCFLVPTMIKMILDYPDIDQYDLSSLKLITYGSAPISPEVLKKAMEKIKAFFVQGYGMTEGSITMLGPEDHIMTGNSTEDSKKIKRLGSAGKPMKDVEIRIVGIEGVPLPEGQIGKILARGPTIQTSYWKSHENKAEMADGGWIDTGDMGYMDDEGFLFIVGRDKDIIIRGGENIDPKEIENILDAHPKVDESAVIGMKDNKWGEAVRAIVVLKKAEALTEEELIEYCRDRLAGYKKPKSVVFVESLPRNPMGKILKRVLRDQFGH